MIVRRAAMRQPYTARQCLELANSLIEKSVRQVQLVEWKQKMSNKIMQAGLGLSGGAILSKVTRFTLASGKPSVQHDEN
jgi:hypothetical protein